MGTGNSQYYQSLNLKGQLVALERPLVMGILNITPDSFFAGSRSSAGTALLEKAGRMLSEGADLLDIGGQSTRPGAALESEETEGARVLPAVEAVLKAFPDAMISIDTFYSGIAEAAVKLGAAMVNDVSGGFGDPKMAGTVARLGIPYILMHRWGEGLDLHHKQAIGDLAREVTYWFSQRLEVLHAEGVNDIILDPGLGFGKTQEENYALLRGLSHLHILGKPLLVGLSRKSMIWRPLETTADDALAGTIALNTLALERGANILRVHDVREAVQTIKVFQEYCRKADAFRT